MNNKHADPPAYQRSLKMCCCKLTRQYTGAIINQSINMYEQAGLSLLILRLSFSDHGSLPQVNIVHSGGFAEGATSKRLDDQCRVL